MSMASTGVPSVPQNRDYDHYLNLLMVPTASEEPQVHYPPWDSETLLFVFDTQYDSHQIHQAHHSIQKPHDQIIPSVPFDVHQIGDPVSIPSLLSILNTSHGNSVTSMAYYVHGMDWDVTHWDTRMIQIDHESGTDLHPSLQQSTTYPSTPCFSNLHSPTWNNGYITEPIVPHNSLPYEPFTPIAPHATSNAFPETAPPLLASFYRGPYHKGATSSCSGRSARAVEYGGVWIDEEELLKSLTNSSGELNIHKCLWELGSPCHIWIKGEKSCIHAHLQKWHGVARGEDKTLAQCRWSGCGKVMRKESVARHIVSIHLDEKWECQGCGKSIARNDAYGMHSRRSDFEACRTSGALVTYAVETKVINARAALDGGGSIHYASANLN